MPSNSYYPRYIHHQVVEALEYSPVVLIQGPRRCGKSTLARTFLDSKDDDQETNTEQTFKANRYITFDDPEQRELADFAPSGYLASLPDKVIFDEVQKAPQLFEAIKMDVDRNRRPGMFLLTGSCDVLKQDNISDSLAGRVRIIRMDPLAQCEVEQTRPNLLDVLLSGEITIGRYAEPDKPFIQRLTAGGYPDVLKLPRESLRIKWYDDYSRSMIDRDLRDISRIHSIASFPQLLESAAANTSSLLNSSSLASPLKESHPTVKKFILLLEQIFLLERLPAWYKDGSKRLVRRPKLHLLDSGVATSFLKMNSQTLENKVSVLGKLLESFVVQELKRQASWYDGRLSFSHFRNRSGLKVDLVIEDDNLSVAGIGIKAARTVSKHDFKGLKKLAQLTGERFVGGIVLYDGDTCSAFGKGLFAVPLRSLWEPLPEWPSW